MTSMGMDKSGAQTIAVNTWVKLTGFVVRAGYPGTVITNNSLVMDAGAVGNVTFRGQFNTAFQVNQFRVVHNHAGGSTVLATVNTQTVGTVNGLNVAPGDTLDLEAFTDTTFAQSVQPGAAVTYLVFDQTTQAYNISAQPQTTTWSRTAQTQVNRAANAAPVQTDWAVSADTHLRDDYDVEAAPLAWQWDVSAELSRTAYIGPAPDRTVGEVIIGVRTVDGRVLERISCGESTDLKWGRERNNLSRCVITTADLYARELVPWLNWIDVWEDGTPVWTGPIQDARTALRTGQTTIEASDPAVFAWYTRVPITKQWNRLDTAPIAAELWQAMNEQHGIVAPPVLLPPTIRERFDFSVTADSRRMNEVIEDLVRLGLGWTVVAGRPILGTPAEDHPTADLAECDFMAELTRIRSGKRAANNVRVQGANWAHNEIRDMAGLNLQALISLDDLRGVASIESAAREYLDAVGAIRDTLEIPASASLSPDADISVDMLIPGNIFTIHADDIAANLRLKSVEVSYSPGARDVRVTFDALLRPIALDGGTI